jgi:hypothetical protein
MVVGKAVIGGTIAATDYQTVELVRAAEVPAIEGIDGELDAILRTALAEAVADRYAHAADFGDALAGYQRALRLNVSTRDLALLLRTAQVLRPREALEPAARARVQAELDQMRSLLDGDAPPPSTVLWN